MSRQFQSVDELFSAVVPEPDSTTRRALFRAHRDLLTEPILLGIAGQGSELAKAGESARALKAFQIGLEAAEAAEQPRPRLALLLRLSDLHARIGPPAEAFDTAQRARAVATSLVAAGQLDLLAVVVNAAGRAADIAIKEGDFPRAREALAEARRVARSAGSRSTELWVLRNLLSTTVHAKNLQDWRALTEYALEVGRLLNLLPGLILRPGEPPAPEPGIFTDVLAVVTRQAYAQEDFALSASLARVWRLTAPANTDATRDLALSVLRLGQFAEAELLWRELSATAPGDASVHANLAGALSGQGKNGQALTELDRALEIAPDDLTFRRFRVQTQRASGNLAAAIADLTEMIRLCDAQLAAQPAPGMAKTEETASRPAPQTRLQYERHLPVRDTLDLSLLDRASLAEKIGDFDLAFADLARVAREADPPTAAAAWRIRSRILMEQKQPVAALAALREGFARAPAEAKSRLALATILIERQEDAEAIDLLSALVLKEELADQVVAVLTPVVKRSPANRPARVVRGFAAETAKHPSVANDDFSAVLSQEPENASLFFRRGRIRLMQGSAPEDEIWNRSLSARRVLQAAEDFAHAVSLDSANEDALHSLRWLVDRICTTMLFHGSFRDQSSATNKEIFKIFPGLEGALAEFLPALSLASAGQYPEALEKWRALQAQLLELSMPVSACRIDLYMADSLLRLFEIQDALNHLEQARQLIFLVGQPLSPSLASQAMAMRQKESRASGRPVVVLETEFANVYGLFLEDLPQRIDLLRIDALGRTGDFKGMLEILAQNPDFESVADPKRINAQHNIAARLRDAGLPERALALTELLNGVSSDPADRGRLLNLRGSIHLALRHRAAAEKDFRAALEFETSTNPKFAPFISLNLVRLFLDEEKFGPAQELLEQAKGKLNDATTFERMTYHWLTAEAALGREQIDPASLEVELALDLAEQLRGGWRDSSNRIAWQGRLTSLYDLAIHIALQAEDFPRVFELVERTRARAYLDALQSGVSAPPESARELVENLAAVQVRRDLLLKLNETMRLYGPTFIDVELISALAPTAPWLALLHRTASGRQVILPARLTEALEESNAAISLLEKRIDDLRLAAMVNVVGATLSRTALAELLRAASKGATEPGPTGPPVVVLVEYFSVHGVLCCLIMRAGEEAPSLHFIDVKLQEIADLASDAPGVRSGRELEEPWEKVLSQLIAPVAGRSNPEDLLWIVPCGPLHQLPFHAALLDAVPLLERNPVCYSPSASVLPECLRRSHGSGTTALVFGDARGDLPFARAECESVAARFRTQPFLGRAATEEAFFAALKNAPDRLDILHLATHGNFDSDDVFASGIELGGPGEETVLTSRDVVRSHLPVDLVTLSACQSGRTRVFAGDEPVGLSRAFLSAGASSVLATLWLTNDLSTRLIVERFYEALMRPGHEKNRPWRKAAALREAAIYVRRVTVGELLAHPDSSIGATARALAAERKLDETSCPFTTMRYWAPFILVGAWA